MNIAIASDGSNIKTGDLVLARNGKTIFGNSLFFIEGLVRLARNMCA